MVSDEKLNSNHLAICELTKELEQLPETFDSGNPDLISLDVEHILKITSDVTYRIKS